MSFSSCRKFVRFLVVCLCTIPSFTPQTFAGDPSPNFSFSYLGHAYDNQTDTTEFTYELCWNGTPPGLSHFLLGVHNCNPDLIVVNSGLNPLTGCNAPAQPAVDGSTGVYGIKWDNCSNFPTGCDTFTVKVSGNHLAGHDVTWLAKAGNCQQTNSCAGGQTTGPACDIGNYPPTCRAGGPYEVACGNGTAQVMVDGSTSSDPECQGPAAQGNPSCNLQYSWTTDCPEGVIDNNTSVTPTVSFNSEHPVGYPLTCSMFLTVTDAQQAQDECQAVINVDDCVFDCLGVPGGDATYDDCGVCNGGNEAKDDCGVCFGNNEDKDDCGVCFGNNENKDDCGVCYGENEDLDECGVCFGNNSTCADCLGIPNGTAVVDQCGVCNGDNSTCGDCAGIPNGTTVVDDCGVCGGNNSTCSDCAGVPNGTAVIDQCNVCGGNNSTCTDCAGVPNGNSVLDECNVCGGDGSSCENVCTEANIQSDLVALDGLGLEASSFVRHLGKQLRKRTGNKKAATFEIAEANKLYTNNWELTWSIPQVIKSNCTQPQVCVAVSHASAISQYQTNHTALCNLAKKLISQLKKLGVKTVALAKKQKQLAANDEAIIASIPLSNQSCS